MAPSVACPAGVASSVRGATGSAAAGTTQRDNTTFTGATYHISALRRASG